MSSELVYSNGFYGKHKLALENSRRGSEGDEEKRFLLKPVGLPFEFSSFQEGVKESCQRGS